MDRQYRAFLLRCWQLGGECRFEIAHIQSGALVRVTTLAEVVAWLDANLGSLPPQEEAPPGAEETSAPPGRR